jgi:hypothetical protein
MSRWKDAFNTAFTRDTSDTFDTCAGTGPQVSQGVRGVSPERESARSDCRAAPPAQAMSTRSNHEEGTGAADLRMRYEERAAIRQHSGHYAKAEAERLAWAEVALDWYRQHGQRMPGHLCAGCGETLHGATVHALPHGEHVHTEDGDRCLLRYGRRRRRLAALALAAIGIPTPPEIAAEIEEDEPMARGLSR